MCCEQFLARSEWILISGDRSVIAWQFLSQIRVLAVALSGLSAGWVAGLLMITNQKFGNNDVFFSDIACKARSLFLVSYFPHMIFILCLLSYFLSHLHLLAVLHVVSFSTILSVEGLFAAFSERWSKIPIFSINSGRSWALAFLGTQQEVFAFSLSTLLNFLLLRVCCCCCCLFLLMLDL